MRMPNQMTQPETGMLVPPFVRRRSTRTSPAKHNRIAYRGFRVVLPAAKSQLRIQRRRNHEVPGDVMWNPQQSAHMSLSRIADRYRRWRSRLCHQNPVMLTTCPNLCTTTANDRIASRTFYFNPTDDELWLHYPFAFSRRRHTSPARQ